MKRSPMPPRTKRLDRGRALRRVALTLRSRRPSPEWTAVRRVVWRRCEGACERCGGRLQAGRWPCHHRKPRARGGRDEVVNAVALCTDCHTAGPLAVHSREVPAGARGLMLRRHQNPAAEPVLLHGGWWVLLTPDGAYAPVPTSEEST